MEQVDFYTAFMRAADHIEQNPDSFDFREIMVPSYECGTKGCALGWVGFYANLSLAKEETVVRVWRVSKAFGRRCSIIFYEEMDSLEHEQYGHLSYENSWICNPFVCAKLLRLYAKQYFTSSMDPALRKVLDNLEQTSIKEDLTV